MNVRMFEHMREFVNEWITVRVYGPSPYIADIRFV